LFTTVYLAGITSVSGGLLAGLISPGGVVFFMLSSVFSVSSWYAVIVGASVIVTVIFNPEGLVGPFHAKLDARRQRAAAVPALTVPAGAGGASADLAGAGLA